MIGKNIRTGKGHGVSEEGESRNNEDVNRCPAEVVERQAIMHSQRRQWQQQQPLAPQGPIVCWENFLPVRSLKVLLVENDDSTRHVVSALLRNCSYEVRAVANGLEAWKILEDLTNHVDLVLTEVAMPGLSGIDLLSKITGHKTCKNIPVIMMSSNDSMRVVFKCLSNGAVDFLVKPIRKNELKNLWQHVWRKCHSSSGSESGIRTQKSTKSKSVRGSDNNTDSNDAEDSESTGFIYRNGSDDDSGTQSSCSKRALEVQTQPVLQCDDLADSPGSTCAQVIHSRPEAQSSKWVPTNITKMIQNEVDKLDNVEMGKDSNSDVQLRKRTDKVVGEVSSTGMGRPLDLDMKEHKKKQGKDAGEHSIETAKDDMKHNDNDVVINATANVSIPRAGNAQNEAMSDVPKVTNVKQMDSCDKKDSSLELSLQKLRDAGSSGTNVQGHNVLRHSDHSAFSRYNTTSTTNQALTGNIGSCSPVNYSLEAPKTESMQHVQNNSTGTQYQVSDGSSNNIDMGSTTNNVSTKPESLNDKSIPSSTVSVQPKTESMQHVQCVPTGTPNQVADGSSNIDMGSTTNNVSTKPESLNDKSIPRSTVSVHHSYTFQPGHHGHCPSAQTIVPGIPDATKMVATQAMPMHQHAQVEHHHYHHYHHHHHHVHSLQQQQRLPLNSDDSSSRSLVAATSHCMQSDKLGLDIEGNAANYASASESNNGSTVQNGNSTAGIAEGTNVTNDNGAPGACATGSGSRSGLDQDRLTLREDALNKFRQKRKERCFEKKVRYQSRKMLAEQRPHVRGQFVRQAVDGNRIKDECNDTNS